MMNSSLWIYSTLIWANVAIVILSYLQSRDRERIRVLEQKEASREIVRQHTRLGTRVAEEKE